VMAKLRVEREVKPRTSRHPRVIATRTNRLCLVRGYTVEDIVGGSAPRKHKLTPFARVKGTRVTYSTDTVPGER
jgi:hypothetical protein